jgi:hypothetical protein
MLNTSAKRDNRIPTSNLQAASNSKELNHHLPSSHNGIPLGKKRRRYVIDAIPDPSPAIEARDNG